DISCFTQSFGNYFDKMSSLLPSSHFPLPSSDSGLRSSNFPKYPSITPSNKPFAASTTSPTSLITPFPPFDRVTQVTYSLTYDIASDGAADNPQRLKILRSIISSPIYKISSSCRLKS